MTSATLKNQCSQKNGTTLPTIWNRVSSTNKLAVIFQLTVAIFLVISSPSLLAQFNGGRDVLIESYKLHKHKLDNNAYQLPLVIQSRDIDQTMSGEIYGILEHSFQTVTSKLAFARNWCDITPLHLNIKSCTYQSQNSQCVVSIYTGRKFYEPPEEVYIIQYLLTVDQKAPDYFSALLTADKGPVGTKDYRIELEATPLDDKRTFIRFSYEYKYNTWTKIGMDFYLATLGNKKIGFTESDTDEHGDPVYIGGVRGIIERNAVRYYLAIKSHLDTLSTPKQSRFDARINRWFDLTEQHHRQLHELDKDDYIKYKHMEHADQIKLQNAANKTTDNQNKYCFSTE